MKRLMVLAPLAVGALPGSALANDRDLRATPIPAAACVATGRGTDGVGIGGDFSAGAYVVTGNFPENAGSPKDQRLQCGLPVNNLELSNPSSNDNDITSFQVLYRDADGRGPETLVEVALNQTVPLASGALQSRPICRWSSNANGTAATGYTRANVPCAHDIPPGAFYHFTVRLFTTATGATTPFAGFAGITFP
jgi:hypothetical protein